MPDFLKEIFTKRTNGKTHHHVVVGGLLMVNGKALVMRRAKHEKFLPGYYDLPGGGLNPGEGPEDGLRRAFREETGIAVIPLVPYYAFIWYSDPLINHCIQIDYLVKLQNPRLEVRLDEEHDAYRLLESKDLAACKMAEELKLSLTHGYKAAKIWNI